MSASGAGTSAMSTAGAGGSAGLKAVSVMGVRSFGPEAADRQTVKFQRPLTLILGANGCGKSTLLEALLFALCDELPPGSDHGRSFLHHPSLCRAPSLRAQVRLEFTGSGSSTSTAVNNYMVVRSMQLQLKQKKMQFTRLDSFIKTVDRQGNAVEISGRCGDTNNTIANILGVSKAILSNVIFCHQEDSNWPLEEGKKLKERFDAIFDATKYNKIFESIRKMRKQYATDIKLLDQKVQFLSEKKEESENKKRKLYTDEEKIINTKSKVEELNGILKPIQSRLREINVVETNLVKFTTKKETTKGRIENCLSQQENLKNRIINLFKGTDEELKEEIESFVKNLRDKEKLLDKTGNNITMYKSKENALTKRISSNEMRINELFTLEGQNQEKISARNIELFKIADFADVPKPNEIDDENDANILMTDIKTKHTLKQNEITDLKKKMNSEENILQKRVDECRDILSRHKEAISNKKKEIKNLTVQTKKLLDDISEATESKSKLETIKVQMESANEDFQKLSDGFDTSICDSTINKNEHEINTLESEQLDIDNLITNMQRQNSKLTEINMLNESLNSKQKTLSRLKNKNKDSMIVIVGEQIPDNNFKRFFNNQLIGMKNEVEKLQNNLKKKQNDITKLEAKRKHEKNELDNKKAELSKEEEKIYSHCKNLSVEEVLSKHDSEIRKLQDEKSELSSSEFVIKRYISKLEETDPNCPLCHRGFDDKNEVSELVTELQDKIQNVPKKLDSVIETLSKNVTKRDQLITLRPSQIKIDSLKNEDIPALEKKILESDKLLDEAQSSFEDTQISLVDPQNKLSVIESILPDMTLLDQLVTEITTLTADISKLESAIESVDTNMTLEELNSRNSQIKKDIQKLRSEIKSNRTQLTEHNVKLNAARDKKNELKEKYLQTQSKVQELCSIQNRYDETIALKDKINTEIEDLSEKSSSFADDLKTANENKTSALKKLRSQLEELQTYVSKLDKMYSIVQKQNEEISEHNAKDIPAELKKIKETLDRFMDEKEKLLSDINKEMENISQIKDEISNQTINKRDLEDNSLLRKCINDREKLELELQQLEEKVGELNHSALSKEKGELCKTEYATTVEIARKEGEVTQLQESVNITKNELKQKQYKNVEVDYKTQMCDLEILKAADKDIKDYAFAMDCCLMKYHKDRMEKVNMIVRELWRTIYRGNDIDYIEIKTDETTSNTGSGNRRVYNYRVVQRRNDVEIDMRGSCSAGQKVLTCLIIRMALAETFSNRFGVLALDEPTTNLDRENVLSLCSALRDMVMSRMQQNNFLFIIITHDAEFLTSLGKIDKLHHYYKVSRNQEGKTRITKELMP